MTELEKLQKILVIDDGHSHLKTAKFVLDGTRVKIECSSMLAQATMDDSHQNFNAGERTLPKKFFTEGETFYVHDRADSDPRASSEYYKTNLNRVLNHYAMYQAGFSGQSLDLVSTLPLENFYMNDGTGLNKKNTKVIGEKKESLKMPVKALDSSSAAPVINLVTVLPEGIMSVYDRISNEYGSIDEDYINKRILCIDIGGKTSDLCVITFQDDGESLNPTVEFQYTQSLSIGMLSIIDSLRKMTIDGVALKTLKSYQWHELLTNKKIVIAGKELNLTTTINDLAKATAQRLVNAIKGPMMDDFNTLDLIIAVGGGGELLKEHLRKIDQRIEVPEDPQFATARGCLKFAAFILEGIMISAPGETDVTQETVASDING